MKEIRLVREIEIEQGINDDGGGIRIRIRLDSEPPERVLEMAFEILEKLNGKKSEKEDMEVEVV